MQPNINADGLANSVDPVCLGLRPKTLDHYGIKFVYTEGFCMIMVYLEIIPH